MTILPIVIHDDIELWATTKLRALINARSEPYTDNVYVSDSIPATKRDRMVIVRRDGGPRLDVVREAPRLGVNVWVKDSGPASKQDANDLARMVSALLWASPDGDPVSRVTITGGPYPVAEDPAFHVRYITAELISHGRNAA